MRKTSSRRGAAAFGPALVWVACGLVVICSSGLSYMGVPAVVAHAASSAKYDRATGFRIKHYRAATPDDVPGGIRVEIDELEKILVAEDVVLVDVMPATGAGYDPKTGVWRLARTHEHIPGSTWLPDVGRGLISDELDAYFRTNLDRLTGGDKARPLVIYCQSDCWMGWNAVQRAAGYGYATIYWYPDGIDGWRDWEKPFAPAKAVPVDVSP